MASRGASQNALPLDEGSWVRPLAETLELFEAAAPGALILYARGHLIHGETSRYVMRLYEAGLADLRQPRAVGGFQYFVRKRPGGAGLSAVAAVAAESDDATDAILRALKRAANLNDRCPSDAELARLTGLPTRHAAAWRVTKLKKAGIIRTSVEDGPDGPWRTVIIVETKKQTLLPPKLRAVRRSVRECAADDEGGFAPRHGEGPGGMPGQRRWE
jgi:hypothetical protein